LERRFRQRDFDEWGYRLSGEKPTYIHIQTGEILPLHFDDVGVINDQMLISAMRIVDETINFFAKEGLTT